jgi:sugar phosphate isomerase/epimerase
MKLGANTVLFAGFDLKTAIEHIAWSGYDGVELAAIKGMCEHLNLDTYQQDASEIKDLLASHNLELLAMELASLDESRLLRAFEAAAALGIPVVNIGPGGKSDVEEDLRRQIDFIRKMARKAESHGVVLCVKAHVGQSIYNTPTTLRAMAEIDSPGFGVDMDPSHIYRSGENPVEALGKVISRVGHVHIRDCVNRAGGPGPIEEQTCGRGSVDLLGYIKVLCDNGYQGPVDLEIIGAPRDNLPRCTIVAAESRGYLNACLKACQAR